MRDLAFERAVRSAAELARIPSLRRVVHRACARWEDEHGNFTPGILLPDRDPGESGRRGEPRSRRTPAIRTWKFGADAGRSRGTCGVSTLGFAPGEKRRAHVGRERLELARGRHTRPVPAPAPPSRSVHPPPREGGDPSSPSKE